MFWMHSMQFPLWWSEENHHAEFFICESLWVSVRAPSGNVTANLPDDQLTSEKLLKSQFRAKAVTFSAHQSFTVASMKLNCLLMLEDNIDCFQTNESRWRRSDGRVKPSDTSAQMTPRLEKPERDLKESCFYPCFCISLQNIRKTVDCILCWYCCSEMHHTCASKPKWK